MDLEKLVADHIKSIQIYRPGEDAKNAAKLSSNENPYPPNQKIVDAVQEALAGANRYPPSGSPRLTAALAKHHGVNTDEIMVGAGSNEILDLLVRSFVAENENVVFPVPSFIVYSLVAKICNREGRGVLCSDYRLDLPAMKAAIDENTRMVFVCNPNNPTSTYVTDSEIAIFLEGLREDILVVMDEAYIDYVDATNYPDSLALRKKRNSIIILRTYSKFYSVAGIRIGYAIADPVVINTLHRVRQPFNVSLLAQAAGLAALECGADLQSMAAEVHSERDRVRKAVTDLGFSCPPSQTNFVFVDLKDNDMDLYVELEKHSVIIRRMGQFGSSNNTYRISIGSPDENTRLIAALTTICERSSS